MRVIPLIFGLIFVLNPLLGQEKYWIYFTDKDGLTDVDSPLSKTYLDSLQVLNVKPIRESRWLNAISAYLKPETNLESLGFVKKVSRVAEYSSQFKKNPDTPLEMYHALNQINGSAFIQAGLSGKKVKIGIIDGGFEGALKNEYLKKIFQEERMITAKDFVTDRDLLRSTKESSKDWHGTSVWKFIAGINDGIQLGLATDAFYYLARTEHGDKEYRGEEDNWVAAIEWMHNQGVRLVNSSLGYSIGFSNPEEDYQPEQMDGRTSAISQAAQIAVEEKNMILVVSAGNDGNDPEWKVISTPADAKGVISVGATYREVWSRVPYSGIGTDLVEFIKPNVSCYSTSGTSFSSPIITGMIGCMLEKDSTLTSLEITDLLQQSAHLYPFANNYLGYGVPDCGNILEQMNEGEPNSDWTLIVKPNMDYHILHCDDPEQKIVVFHKKDKRIVFSEKIAKPQNGRVKINRPRNAKFTTIYSDGKVTEIQWE